MKPASASFDAIVIGSGFAGAVTACRLTQAGQNVCILERGRRYLASDLPVLPESEFSGAREEGGATIPDRSLPDFSRAFWQLGQGLWEVRDLGSLVACQAAGWGGGSLIYANVHLRPPLEAFERWPRPFAPGRGALDGAEAPPLEPYFDLAAYMLEVEALPEDAPRKTVAFEKAAAALGHPTFRPPLAVNFGEDRENRFGAKQGACDLRAACTFGCRKQAKNTLDLNYLRVAEEAGADVRTLAEVVRLARRRRGGKPDGYRVQYRDHLSGGQRVTLEADYLFLCAGALNTTELLLRSRAALGVKGQKLGESFYPNADDLVVTFDCDEVQELDRGPTITSSLVYEDGDRFFLVQDGGFPTHLEPWLGLYRSPFWLHRNGYARPSARHGSGASQRTPYAPLPFESLFDGFASFTGGAITSSLPIFHDISQTFLAFARGGRDLEAWSDEHRDDLRVWTLLPDQLRRATVELRNRSLDQIALHAEPALDGLIADTAERVAPDIQRLMNAFGDQIETPDIEASRIAEWGMRLAVQNTWGSQAGLLGTMSENLRKWVLPTVGDLPGRAAAFLRWAMEYRLGDGHTAALLSMGRDTWEPWRLALDQPEGPRVGDRVEGRASGGSGIVVASKEGVLVLSAVTGAFQPRERLAVGERTFGIAEAGGLEDLDIRVKLGRKGPGEDEAASFPVHALRYEPVSWVEVYGGREGDGPVAPGRGDEDGKGGGSDGGQPVLVKRQLPLVARIAGEPARSQRLEQELLLRDVSAKLGGELRADPVEAFLDRRVTVHAQGGCPMGDDARTAVTGPEGEVFGCDGLFVMDGAAFPAPVGVNPSAAIAAVAEFKIQHFVTSRLGLDALPEAWQAQRSDAVAWARSRRDFLDPLARRRRERVALVSQPVGIAFNEVMKGTHQPLAGDDDEQPIAVALAVSVPDLGDLLHRNGQGLAIRMEAEGALTIAGCPGVPNTEQKVEAGSHLEFCKPRTPSGLERRELRYRLGFEVNGVRHRLVGTKHIRDDEHFDIWEDTTTLFFALERVDLGHAALGESDARRLRRGVLRVPASDFFGTQLRSMRATGVDNDPARQAWAIASFVKFFFGHLVDVYVPGFQKLLEVARGVTDKGHV